ncbi:bifunctional hydroxymethylpyrimidine kinase/phosphomethylpyrimidine kinase [Pseudofrancisella aestuarii]|uniref:hydroxymethylpyrimidine kinase n=1 Tax=Pseudofrancisella aestuarii TaxID=2670347 RepID=A0ABV9TDL7_9GAMM|nr:bifunctional hydroxymethylpyrimidine kinase/phosphomethylpyrimidine kinase [Pseudofrancisella aestuarii]
MKYKCLSIAGFDGSGGAGLQADLKTFSALGCYGMTVLTALPVQNTCGVKNCYDISLKCIKEQLETIFEDIRPDAIKIGMLFTSEIINLIANFLEKNAKDIPIVLDPVMVAKSGDLLLQKDAINILRNKLLPIVNIVTPNIPEAEELSNLKYLSKEKFAEEILKFGCEAVLVKGGHEKSGFAEDLFMNNKGEKHIFTSERINSKNTHGTGCTLSAAITSFLAKGYSYVDACGAAKKYLHGALLASKDINIGKGNGPVHHFYDLWNR